VPISPFLKCTFQMATAISITMASEKKRVNKPRTTAIPPKNSVPAKDRPALGKAERGYRFHVVVESAEDLVITVRDHDCA